MLAPLPIETSAIIIKVDNPTSSFFSYLNKLEADKKAEEARKAAEALKAAQEAAEKADLDATAARLQPIWTFANSYAPLNCTAYVASRISVPNLGNAKFWGYGLIAAGWRTGAPRRGAIGVSTRGWAGHVVIAEYNNPDGTVHISEYNHIPYSYDERDVSAYMFQWYF